MKIEVQGFSEGGSVGIKVENLNNKHTLYPSLKEWVDNIYWTSFDFITDLVYRKNEGGGARFIGKWSRINTWEQTEQKIFEYIQYECHGKFELIFKKSA